MEKVKASLCVVAVQCEQFWPTSSGSSIMTIFGSSDLLVFLDGLLLVLDKVAAGWELLTLVTEAGVIIWLEDEEMGNAWASVVAWPPSTDRGQKLDTEVGDAVVWMPTITSTPVMAWVGWNPDWSTEVDVAASNLLSSSKTLLSLEVFLKLLCRFLPPLAISEAWVREFSGEGGFPFFMTTFPSLIWLQTDDVSSISLTSSIPLSEDDDE